ncbi:MAG TPA: dihydrodipicolinate synthase family protein [Ruminococcaceae bacterium]|nr:dihydrodipicolinate synthase family protein [Oscillospiraceae bacterium]
MSKTIPNGVYPTMITPYTADNKIDYGAVEQLLNWYSEKGCDGIFAICQSSEIFFLSFEERYNLLKFVMQHAPKNLTIVASGHTADDLDQQLYEAQKFIELGAEGYVFISNRLAKQGESDDVFLKNADMFMEALPDTSFGIYECPYPYKRLMMPETLGKLAQTGRFSFLKDTCCSLKMIREKLDAVKGTGLKIYNANAATLLESLKMGCAGYSGVMANFHPEIYAWLCKNFEKDPEKAELVQSVLGYFSVTERQVYPINAKYYLGLDGLNLGYTSRARSVDEFGESSRMEIQQMKVVTDFVKKTLNIQ